MFVLSIRSRLPFKPDKNFAGGGQDEQDLQDGGRPGSIIEDFPPKSYESHSSGSRPVNHETFMGSIGICVLGLSGLSSCKSCSSCLNLMEHSDLTEKIIGCAMKVHRVLGPGFLESVYQNSLVHELRKNGIIVECEKAIAVTYDGLLVGQFAADLLVEGVVLVENKAVQILAPAHEVQVVNYLTATGVDIGLLLNFGAEKLEFKRKYRTYRSKSQG